MSEHVFATSAADGRLLGGAIERPAPQTTTKRSAATASSKWAATWSVIGWERHMKGTGIGPEVVVYVGGE